MKIPAGPTLINGQKQTYSISPTDVSTYNNAKYGTSSAPIITTLWNNKALANSTQTWKTIETKMEEVS